MATATLPAPSRVSKRSLTLTEAADQWEDAKREIERLKPLLDEAGAVLLNHFDKTGRSSYRGRIVLTFGPSRLVLDQAKVREFLADRLPQFQKRTEPSRSLSLLQ
jgi:hypothetical protein